MNKTRLVAGLVILSLVLCIAVAGSILVVDNFSETKVSENDIAASESANYGTILKSTNETEKLAKGVNAKSTKKKENIKVDAKEKAVIIETNKSDKKSSRKTKTDKISKKKTKKKKTSYKSVGKFKVTGYCSCASCCGKTNGITASGTKATAGKTIAADTSRLPFGTKVVIDGHTYTVEDRGGAIKGNKIDVFFSSHSKALQWGVRYCEVYVME